MVNWTILLDRVKSISIYENIAIGQMFYISLKAQDIQCGDYVYLCSYLKKDYPNKNRRNSMLSIIKCRVISYELTRDKSECIYSTNTSDMKIKLEYFWNDRRLEPIFEFNTGYKFVRLETIKNEQYDKLEYIFNLREENEEV